MFVVNEDLSIYATRGDVVFFSVTAESNGENYVFQAGDVVRMTIYGKKDAQTVVMQKDFPVTTATESVEIYLTEQDTRIGEIISKPTDYWYEVELNPFTNPQTIIGYDEDGAKVFKLFPEGRAMDEETEDTEEDIPTVDTDLDFSSPRPVENRAIARAMAQLEAGYEAADEKLTEDIEKLENALTERSNSLNGSISNVASRLTASKAEIDADLAVERARIDNLVASPTPGDSELVDIRVGADGMTYESAGTAVRNQFASITDDIEARFAEHKSVIALDFVQGGLVNGEIDVGSERCVTNTKRPIERSIRVEVKSGFKYAVAFYKEDGTCNVWEWLTENHTFSEYEWLDVFKEYRIVVAYENNNEITPVVALDAVRVTKDSRIVPTNGSVEESALTGELLNNYTRLKYREGADGYIVQLYDDSAVDKTGCYLADGSFWTTNDYYSTGLFPIVPGMKLMTNYTSETSGAILTLWDSNGDFVSMDKGITIRAEAVTIPDVNASYARLSIPMQLYSADIQIVNDEIVPSVKLPYMVAIPKSYRYLASNYCGCKMVNFGDSMTSMERWQATTVNCLGLAGYERVAQSGGTLVDIYKEIENIPTEADIVTVWIGTNDFGNSKPLGAITDRDQSTFYGCYKYICEYIAKNLPNASVLCITPLPRWDFKTTNYDDLGRAINNSGNTLAEFADAVKSVAELFGYSVYDLYRESGINEWNMDKYFDSDKLHLNVGAGVTFGQRIAKRITLI